MTISKWDQNVHNAVANVIRGIERVIGVVDSQADDLNREYNEKVSDLTYDVFQELEDLLMKANNIQNLVGRTATKMQYEAEKIE